MQRRNLIAAAAALPLVPLHALAQPAPTPGVSTREILFGQTADLSASRAAISKPYAEGAALYFEEINAKGGLFGRKIRVKQLDDAYQVPVAEKNARELVEKEGVFGLVHTVGTAITDKLIPYVDEQGVPHVHPFTGADQVRPPARTSRHTFFLRASYGREVDRIVEQLHTLGIQRIALVHEDEPFGHGIRANVEASMKQRGAALAAIGLMPPNQATPAAVASAVTTVLKAAPQAVIVGSAGPSVEHFIRGYREGGARSQIYCLSVSNVERLYKSLQDLSQGLIVTQVMPPVQTSPMPVVRDYRQAVAAAKGTATSLGLEGYISGRLIVEALRTAGPNLTRARFIAALENTAVTQIGGFPVRYRSEPREGSSFVEMAIIGRQGKLVW
jgi:ABC-type branched-subunit amino acid transport system substrate-binding protein